MDRKIKINFTGIVIVAILVLLLFLSACESNGIILTGNISAGAKITESGKLAQLLKEKAPFTEYALLIGADGTAALISEISFSEIQLKKDKNSWYSSSELLPPVCNITDIREICIYQPVKRIIDIKTEKNGKILLFSERIKDFELLGESQKNGYPVRKYKIKKQEIEY
ncbi:MAG TPA: hypothetical protein ENL20_05115 [Candidatus Cloacimonetes bacterium]|nr:hypothetical protein [Candidatus Cloacimonadota bacterium]